MADRIKVRVVIEYETDLAESSVYEGAVTPMAKAAKEIEYIKEDGDYLFQILSITSHTVEATYGIVHLD